MFDRATFFLCCILLSFDLVAAQIRIITQAPQQGSMIVGRLLGDGKVFMRGQALQTDKEGYFVFGVGRDAPPQVKLVVRSQAKEQSHVINIASRQWKVERVDGLAPSKVNPRSPKVLTRIAEEAKLVRAARNKESSLSHFKTSFIMPAKGRISGVYGSQRILNGDPKRPHFGLDVANAVGTPIVAPADGVVSLVHKDMFFSGGTLIIDHGHGISSTYIHLNSIDVTQGESVRQGQRVATIGATGRATGPHLDWRLNWFQVRLDPELLIKNKAL